MERLNLIKNNKGQTAVEYLLMLAMIASLIFSIMGVVKRRFFGDGLNCSSAAAKVTISCRIKAALAPSTADGEGKRFQYYHFRR